MFKVLQRGKGSRSISIYCNLLRQSDSSSQCNVDVVTCRREFVTYPVIQQMRKAVSKHVYHGTETFGEKVKENTKTTYYTAVVLVGVSVTGLMLYTVFKQLLSSFSPQSVYSAAVDKCTANNRVCDLLGDDLKCYGEESRRGRRQHISHLTYEVEGVKGMRIKFHLKGQRRSGTAHLDARENSSGWEFRYLFVQVDSYPHETILIEDNRAKTSQTQSSINSYEGIKSFPSPEIRQIPDLTPLYPSK